MRIKISVVALGAVFACASPPPLAPSKVPSPVEVSAAPTARASWTPARDETNAVAGWFLAGSGSAYYSVGRDSEIRHGGQASVLLRSVEEPGDKFGTLMQSVSAQRYLGKRVRLSAFVRTAEVRHWTGLWLRIDQKDSVHSIDNMQDRPIRGTTVWTEYYVVLDVPTDAVSLNFGVLQTGSGTTWIDDARLEVVDSNVPTTNAPFDANRFAASPKNLDFDE